MLRNFVKFNKTICDALSLKYPRIFNDYVDHSDALIFGINEQICNRKPSRILEIGGIDRPLLEKNSAFFYIGLDIDFAPDCYKKYDKFLHQSIEHEIPEKVDLIISKTLLEHVPDNEKSIKNMYNALQNGGIMVHHVPSKSHPYSLILRLVGPRLQKILIKYLRPHAANETGYPAFFDYCSVGEMRKLLTKNGFQNMEVKPYYFATDYFSFFVPLFLLVALFENFCRKFKLEYFASAMLVTALK